MRYIRFFSFALLAAVLASSAIAQSGGSFEIKKSVIAGGGGRASGGNFAVDGTVGEAVAGGPATGAAPSP